MVTCVKVLLGYNYTSVLIEHLILTVHSRKQLPYPFHSQYTCSLRRFCSHVASQCSARLQPGESQLLIMLSIEKHARRGEGNALHPRGWPMAMAPPCGFTFSYGIFNFSMEYTACEAKASLISKKSISCRLRPVFSNTFGIANAGPTPIILGGTPTTAAVTNLPKIGRPRRLAMERLARSTAAAPSDT